MKKVFCSALRRKEVKVNRKSQQYAGLGEIVLEIFCCTSLFGSLGLLCQRVFAKHRYCDAASYHNMLQ